MSRMVKYRVELVKESSNNYNISKEIRTSLEAPSIIREIYNLDTWHNEKFGMLCLDAQNKVIGCHIIIEGTLNQSPVFVREVIVRALLNNAHAVILFHNHPGGSLTPSKADIECTAQIKKALTLVEIALYDHVILAEDKHTSMAERGQL